MPECDVLVGKRYGVTGGRRFTRCAVRIDDDRWALVDVTTRPALADAEVTAVAEIRDAARRIVQRKIEEAHALTQALTSDLPDFGVPLPKRLAKETS